MTSSTQNETHFISRYFNSIKSPNNLSAISIKASQGLNAEPKSFEKLNDLIKYLYPEQSSYAFEHFYPKAYKVLNGQAFQNLPGALGRLRPLAQNYFDALTPVEKSLASDPLNEKNIREALSQFIQAHALFRERFTIECENASPAAPFTILNRYPNSLRLYFIAFLKQLPLVSPKIYVSWRESIENRGEEVLDLFPHLAIHYLLEQPEHLVPELFIAHTEKIASLRISYDQLSASQKSRLLETIWQTSVPSESSNDSPVKTLEINKNIHDLFLQIGELSSNIQAADRTVFSGVIRIIYQETAKVFAILEHMDLEKPPATREIAFRTLFLSLIKQKILTADQLPLDFSGRSTIGNIQEETLTAHKTYQALSQKEKETFDSLFMKEDRSISDHSPLNDLLRRYEKIHWLFSARSTIFSLETLPMLLYKRS